MFRRLLWLVGLVVLIGTACSAQDMADTGLRGPSPIRFGLTLSDDGLSIEDEKAQFALTDKIVCLADFGHFPLGTTEIDVMLSQVVGDDEYVIDRQPVHLSPRAVQSHVLHWKFNPWTLCDDAGHYRLRLMKADTVLAVGEFELVD